MAAAARKLQKEIDNTLKKVDDGIAEFAEVWEEVTQPHHSAAQNAKLGEELKKSINKLQRFRVQIRDWLSNEKADAKYMDKLDKARKLIEYDMQRFKEVERDLKTKAFSTFALVRGREDDEDLATSEKRKNQEWICTQLQVLNDQVDEFEADLEVLSAQRSKSKISDEEKRLRLLDERHRWHIKKLEQILRSVDNETIDFGDFAVIKEHVAYYIENGIDDEDFPHDETLYDCLDLIDIPEPVMEKPVPKVEDPDDDGPKGRGSKGKKEKKKKEKDAVISVKEKAKSEKKEDPTAVKVEKVENPEDLEQKVQENQLLGDAEEFICKICYVHVVGANPKLTNCSHLFCGDCLNEWFSTHPECQSWAQRAKTAGMERIVPCPVCKQPLNERTDLYEVSSTASRSDNLLLWRMLSGLKIMCTNHPKVTPGGECEWIGEYGTYQEHVKRCLQELDEKKAKLDKEGVAEPSGSAAGIGTPGDPKPAAPEKQKETPAKKEKNTAETKKQPAAKAAPTPTPAPVAAPTAAPQVPPTPSNGLPKAPTHPAPTVASVSAQSAGPKASPERTNYTTPVPAPAAKQTVKAPPTKAATPAPASTPEPTVPAPKPVAKPPPQAASKAPSVDLSSNKGEETPSQRQSSTSIIKETSTDHDDSTTFSDMDLDSNILLEETTDGVKMIPFVGIAIDSFHPTQESQLTTEKDDFVQILERHTSGWTYCKNLTRDLVTPENTNILGTENKIYLGWVPAWLIPDSSRLTRLTLREVMRSQEAYHTRKDASDRLTETPAKPATEAWDSSFDGSEQHSTGTAVTAFTPTTSQQLPLTVGDIVTIIQRHDSGWTFGRTQNHEGGWFPGWMVR